MRRTHSHAASLICSLMLLVGIAGSTAAQSGRRAKERKPPPPPVQQTVEAEPAKPKPETKPEARGASLIVSIDEDQGAGGTFLGSSQLVMRGFVERLKKNSAIKYRVEDRLDRKEAKDLAQSKQDAYVVWLHLERQMISSRREDNDVIIVYVLFTPGTGKSKTEGRIYVRGSRTGRGGIPTGLPLPPTSTGRARIDDAALLDAGREAAERVMPELDVIKVL